MLCAYCPPRLVQGGTVDIVDKVKQKGTAFWAKVKGLGSESSVFDEVPQLAKVTAIVTAVLGLVGATAESLGNAARSATILSAILVATLIFAAFVP